MKHEAWTRDLRRIGLDLSDDQVDLLAGYERLLSSRALPRGMISVKDGSRLWGRHILDGVRGAVELPRPDAMVVDLGSGAGIPGIPVAIARPDARLWLIEPRRARVAFLESVVDDLGLRNVHVLARRAEECTLQVDVCVARAFASLRHTWEMAEPLLAPGGRLIYWAGEGSSSLEEPPSGTAMRLSERAGVADSGPLVIMTRQ